MSACIPACSSDTKVLCCPKVNGSLNWLPFKCPDESPAYSSHVVPSCSEYGTISDSPFCFPPPRDAPLPILELRPATWALLELHSSPLVAKLPIGTRLAWLSTAETKTASVTHATCRISQTVDIFRGISGKYSRGLTRRIAVQFPAPADFLTTTSSLWPTTILASRSLFA